MSDYKEMTAELSKWMQKIGKELPKTAKGFGELVSGADEKGALEKKTKELICLGISIANRCEGCIAFHVKAAVKYGVSREEFLETIATAIHMGGGPSYVYAGMAMKAFEEFSEN